MVQQEYIKQHETHSISAGETRIAVEKSTAPTGIYGSYRLDVLVLDALITISVLTIAGQLQQLT